MKILNKTVLVNLEPSEEEILKKLDKNARWGIGRAKREGLIVEENVNLTEFYPIYLQSMKKFKSTPYSLDYLNKIKKIFFSCKYQDKVIAGILLSIDEITGFPKVHFHASLEDYQKYQPNDLLYWTSVKWAKNLGFKRLDLGGYSIKPLGNMIGVNKYKEKWGEVISYYTEVSFAEWLKMQLIINFGLNWAIDNLRFIRNLSKGVYQI